MDFRDASGFAKLQFIGDGSINRLLFRAQQSGVSTVTSPWKIIAFTDSNITGNAGSATKLQTARTIWGQSFDGTGNVSGALSGVTNINSALYINSSGNVTIGASDLAGSNYKLFVHGDTKFISNANNLELYTKISQSGVQVGRTTAKYTGGYNCGFQLGEDDTLLAYIAGAFNNKDSSNKTQFFYGGTSVETSSIMINGIGGNVGIGTPSPKYKLDINGSAAAVGFVKTNSNNTYLLLGGGGHKAISDFLLKSEIANQELSNNLTTITKTLTVTADWMDTGIKYTDLATGTYIVQVSVYDSVDNIWDGYWSGIMTWYGLTTNNIQSDEILLHRAGHALGNNIYLRTIVSLREDRRNLRLQIAANKTLSTAATYTFKFKRVI